MSNDRSSEVVQRDESIFRLQLQLQQALHKCAEFELQVLNSRDHALGQAAEIGALHFQLERHITDIRNHLAHISRLETALLEAGQSVVEQVNMLESSRREVNALRSSTTWKIGRFFMLPVRVLKRLTRRS